MRAMSILRRHRGRQASLLLACVLAVPAVAQTGLNVDSEQSNWPTWQARVGLSTASGSELQRSSLNGNRNVQGANVLGDYYFAGPAFASGLTGGFRATSGLLMNGRGGPSAASVVPSAGGSLSLARQNWAPGVYDSNADAVSTVPYVGVGYTGVSLKGGWGFTADVGLMAPSVGQATRFGRALFGNQNLDDATRDSRFTPLVQFGMSYRY